MTTYASYAERVSVVGSVAAAAVSAQHNEYTSMSPEEIENVDDLKDAVVLYFRLPEVYSLPQLQQMDEMKKKFPQVHTFLDDFEQQELQEMAELMTELDRQEMYDTKDNYSDNTLAEAFRLEETPVVRLKRYKDIQDGKEKDPWCAGCGCLLDMGRTHDDVQWWKGYRCAQSNREYIFHNRLCVKLRKAKEVIRSSVYENSEGDTTKMQIEFLRNENLDESCRPEKCFTTWDEEYSRTLFKHNIREYRKHVRSTMYRALDLDDGDRWEVVPDMIKFLDLREFGVALWNFLLRQVQIKEFDGFWPLVNFLTLHIDTPTSLEMIDENKKILFPFHTPRRDVITSLFNIVAESSLYPLCTVLYIAAYLRDNGTEFWSEEEADKLGDRFIQMGKHILAQYENHHVVGILLEMPSNIDGLSAIDIALENKMLTFLHEPRISAIAAALWNDRKIINPQHVFGKELTYIEQFRRLCKRPHEFYFSASGYSIIRTALYGLYLAIFVIVTMETRYNYENNYTVWEIYLWIFNIGQALYTAQYLFHKPKVYLSSMHHCVDTIGVFVWIIIFIMRAVFPAARKHDADGTFNATRTRNTLYVEIYMLFWAMQCIMYWFKIVFYLRRLRNVGPMLRMIALMAEDIKNFMMLASLLFLGVSFSLYYVIAKDLPDTGLLKFSSVAQYALTAFMGQPEWDSIKSTDDFSVSRSVISEYLLFLCVTVGTVALLNLLIAMLASTHEEVEDRAELEVNYTRVHESYEAGQQGAVIPPPMIYLAVGLMLIWFLIDFIISVVTMRTRTLNDWFFTPINRDVFMVGDYVDYEDFVVLEGGGTGVEVRSGWVHDKTCNEVAVIMIGDEEKHIHKKDIKRIKKPWLVVREQKDGAKKCCQPVGRYYCKHCRFQFHSSRVGSVQEIKNLFQQYGIVLSFDDVGKLENCLGGFHGGDGTRQKNGCAQLCPECYRPFMADKSYSDTVSRTQFLMEISSYWVFLFTCWIPLIIVLSPLALISFLTTATLTQEQQEKKAMKEQAAKIDSSQLDDNYRAIVRGIFNDEIPIEMRAHKMRQRIRDLHIRVLESDQFDEEQSILKKVGRRIVNMEKWEDKEERIRRITKLNDFVNAVTSVMEQLKAAVKSLERHKDIQRDIMVMPTVRLEQLYGNY